MVISRETRSKIIAGIVAFLHGNQVGGVWPCQAEDGSPTVVECLKLPSTGNLEIDAVSSQTRLDLRRDVANKLARAEARVSQLETLIADREEGLEAERAHLKSILTEASIQNRELTRLRKERVGLLEELKRAHISTPEAIASLWNAIQEAPVDPHIYPDEPDKDHHLLGVAEAVIRELSSVHQNCHKQFHDAHRFLDQCKIPRSEGGWKLDLLSRVAYPFDLLTSLDNAARNILDEEDNAWYREFLSDDE